MCALVVDSEVRSVEDDEGADVRWPDGELRDEGRKRKTPIEFQGANLGDAEADEHHSECRIRSAEVPGEIGRDSLDLQSKPIRDDRAGERVERRKFYKPAKRFAYGRGPACEDIKADRIFVENKSEIEKKVDSDGVRPEQN